MSPLRTGSAWTSSIRCTGGPSPSSVRQQLSDPSHRRIFHHVVVPPHRRIYFTSPAAMQPATVISSPSYAHDHAATDILTI
mmetsp:Transcript_20109/g.40330  ORF Transcript_20109/g.40330 Transcript_20109/m.40330 type:complete len:81 (-) Transcript_20109:726-968(-)